MDSCDVPNLLNVLETGTLNGGCCFNLFGVVDIHVDYHGHFGFAIPIPDTDVLVMAMGEGVFNVDPYCAATKVQHPLQPALF